MTKLTLTNQAHCTTTVLENEFIDKYMAKANGEYVKVYLLLLRHMHEPSGTLTVSKIADLLDCTENDVKRALNYWKKQGLLDFETIGEKQPAPKAVPAESKPDPQPVKAISDISKYRSQKDFQQLLFVTQQYLGKLLTPSETDTIIYFYETLGMSAELIEYLIEYCVENGHKSMHYIQKVALSWHEQNITTVTAAKANTILYNKNCYSVLNAYGIKGRAPAASEITYIKRWNDEYCFSLDIILEACNRTMNAIHQPNFEYTDSILKNWLSKKVKSLSDVAALDADYLKEKERKKKQPAKAAVTNKFNNFENRSYDMDDLERRLIQQ